MYNNNIRGLAGSSKFFTSPKLNTMSIEELQEFAKKRSITIPPNYNTDQIRDYVKSRLSFLNVNSNRG